MAIAFPIIGPPQPASEREDRDADGLYLTDGVRLYRSVGPIAGAPGVVGLEDCRSLDVVAVSLDTITRLRRVVAGGPGERATS